ncbi:MAG: nucleotide exchange factor GrpE [Bacilli bacterium]
MEKEEILEEKKLEEEKLECEPKKEKKNKKSKQIEELNLKLKALEEETLRAKADLINYRKRKDDEVSNLLKYCNSDILMEIISVIDNFERVINKEDINEEVKTYLEGFKLIYKQLKDVLETNDVKEIEALGKEFDPMFHQSVTTRKDDEKESGIVLEVYQKGYTYKDKVLRPAMVIINE